MYIMENFKFYSHLVLMFDLYLDILLYYPYTSLVVVIDEVAFKLLPYFSLLKCPVDYSQTWNSLYVSPFALFKKIYKYI